MSIPIDITPSGPGACSEPCNMCCTLQTSVKTFTKIMASSLSGTYPVTCTKLYWNCTCNGETLVLQRNAGAGWIDCSSTYFSPTANWCYAPPRSTAIDYRLKCVLPGGFTYYSNVVTVAAAAWICQCDDLGTLKNIRIDISGTFTWVGGGGFTWSKSVNVGDPLIPPDPSVGLYGILAGYQNLRTQGFPEPAASSFINLVLYGGEKSFGDGYLAVGEWRLGLGNGSPCLHIAQCASGTMSFCSSCPFVTGNQNYWWHSGGFYNGYSTINSVNAVLLSGC